MVNLIKNHGGKYTREFKFEDGTTYTKNVGYCAEHGELDLFFETDFDARHEQCVAHSQRLETAKLEKANADFNKKISLKTDVRVYAKAAVNKFQAAKEVL